MPKLALRCLTVSCRSIYSNSFSWNEKSLIILITDFVWSIFQYVLKNGILDMCFFPPDDFFFFYFDEKLSSNKFYIFFLMVMIVNFWYKMTDHFDSIQNFT